MKSISNLLALVIGSMMVLGRELREILFPGVVIDRWTVFNLLLLAGLVYVLMLAVFVLDAVLFGRA